MADLPPITDGRQSETALGIQRGAMRLLRSRFDFCVFAEVAPPVGQRQPYT